MFKDYKYSVICKTYIASFFRSLLLSTSNVRMSEGTFCRVAVHMYFHAVLTVQQIWIGNYLFLKI